MHVILVKNALLCSINQYFLGVLLNSRNEFRIRILNVF